MLFNYTVFALDRFPYHLLSTALERYKPLLHILPEEKNIILRSCTYMFCVKSEKVKHHRSYASYINCLGLSKQCTSQENNLSYEYYRSDSIIKQNNNRPAEWCCCDKGVYTSQDVSLVPPLRGLFIISIT